MSETRSKKGSSSTKEVFVKKEKEQIGPVGGYVRPSLCPEDLMNTWYEGFKDFKDSQGTQKALTLVQAAIIAGEDLPPCAWWDMNNCRVDPFQDFYDAGQFFSLAFDNPQYGVGTIVEMAVARGAVRLTDSRVYLWAKSDDWRGWLYHQWKEKKSWNIRDMVESFIQGSEVWQFMEKTARRYGLRGNRLEQALAGEQSRRAQTN